MTVNIGVKKIGKTLTGARKKKRKLPKSVDIGCVKWDIEYDPKVGGGYFKDNTITIGTRNKENILETLFHEVFEAILVTRGNRYRHQFEFDNSGIMFVMNHLEFENFVIDVVSALKSMGHSCV